MITYHHHVKDLAAGWMDARIHSGDLLEFRQQNYHVLRPQWERDYQLLYIVDGCGHFWFDGCEVPAAPGCAVLYEPGQTQEYGYTAQEGVLVYCCHFAGEGLTAFLQQNPIPTGRVLPVGSRRGIPALFERVVAGQHGEDAVLSLLQLLHGLSARLQPLRGEARDPLAPAMADMAENCHLNRTVEEYAALCHLSKYHFLRRFKQRTGKTPITYRNDCRLDVADRLLCDSDLTVEAAALSVGFSSAAYFCRLYKKRRGHSCLADRGTD